ncbi:MAG: TIGR04283 family arsenosugar biosynthesis glycosyltransferase [Desulfobacterales bacterium]|nr:TIGR04283 family arsenosugar biosynthesis glycosyltransferase [Desulfobacterales bacterium]
MRHHLSIIIPVLNEAYIINRTLMHLQNLAGDFSLEIIIVDGDPGGSTLAAVTSTTVKKIKSPKGRGFQMNRGSRLATGEILIFLHADVVLGKDALLQIVAVCRRKDVAGGAFSLGIDSGKRVFRLIERAVSIRSRLTKIPYGDQAIFINKTIYDKIGGFRDIPLMEDVDLMRRLKKAGGKIIILPDMALTSPRRWEKEGVLYCTLRNWMLITLYLLGVAPERLVKFYR